MWVRARPHVLMVWVRAWDSGATSLGRFSPLLHYVIMATTAVEVSQPSFHRCDGYDEEWAMCPNLPACGTCTAMDCKFNPWEDWTPGAECSGLMFRRRSINTYNNECGRPCEGMLMQAVRHHANECGLPVQKCVLAVWSQWTACSAGDVQSYRSREVETPPENGGKPCEGNLKEIRNCSQSVARHACEFSEWRPWTACSSSCGAGIQTRMRVISNGRHDIACKGSLLQTQLCHNRACAAEDCILTDWSEWSSCKGHSQRYRVRNTKQSAHGNGHRCSNSTVQTESCHANMSNPLCGLTPWSEWSRCDKACDGGQHERKRSFTHDDGSSSCSTISTYELKPCGTQPCNPSAVPCEFQSWNVWSICSVSCGLGSKSRTRDMLPAKPGGQGCNGTLQEVSPCVRKPCLAAECGWNDWYDWSACSVSCGGGHQHRNRILLIHTQASRLACSPGIKNELSPCNTHPCSDSDCAHWEPWQEWSVCPATCGGGLRSRKRELRNGRNSCGKPITGLGQEFMNCSNLWPCDGTQDCELSAWSNWTSCSRTCFGIRERSRSIMAFAEGGGRTCHDMPLRQVQPCSPSSPDEPISGCSVEPTEDCQLTEWSSWTNCSSSCGGGQRFRQRLVAVPAAFGGKPCAADTKMAMACNTERCTPLIHIDCRWSAWSEWSSCFASQRLRMRSIEQLPDANGLPCRSRQAKEISGCRGNGAVSLCTWSDWSSPDGCQRQCARSTSRVRSLAFSRTALNREFEGVSQTSCSGAQVAVEHCQPQNCTPTCKPIHCKLGQWSDWSLPSCLGLCERTRHLKSINNECGHPCGGFTSESKVCPVSCHNPQDCVFSPWDEWSTCSTVTWQRHRARKVLRPATLEGRACRGTLAQTKGCRVHNLECIFQDWSAWTTCDKTCGGGHQQRDRSILSGHTITQCKGSLKEVGICGQGQCPVHQRDCRMSVWEPWSQCGSESFNQMVRKRYIIKPALRDGEPCSGPMKETVTCKLEVINCIVSAWTSWDACDRTCGGGQQRRQRQIEQYPQNDGLECPADLMEITSCNVHLCGDEFCEISAWSTWGACSTSCSSGQQMRHRQVLRSNREGCAGELTQMRPCDREYVPCDPSECLWNAWSDWTSCSHSCDGGQKVRHRSLSKMPDNSTASCKTGEMAQTAPCSTAPCPVICQDGEWGDWKSWSKCSATCGGGTVFRVRTVVKTASACGSPASGSHRETAFCNTITCQSDVDCQFSGWNEWEDCVGECIGSKSRSRTIITQRQGDGLYCKGAMKMVSPCSVPHPIAKCNVSPGVHVDCVLSEWSHWSQCSVSCGGGHRHRKRHIEQQPENMGAACSGSLSEVHECRTDWCDGEQPVDCELGEWEVWSACDKCGGQRKRFRKIVNYPQYGGASCKPFDHEETVACPLKCHAKHYCTWSDWQSWGSCTETCGPSKRSRRRYLYTTTEHSGPPQSVSEMLAEYQLLQLQAERLEHWNLQNLIVAFFSGSFTFVVGCLVASRYASECRGSMSTESADARVLGVERPHPSLYYQVELQETGCIAD